MLGMASHFRTQHGMAVGRKDPLQITGSLTDDTIELIRGSNMMTQHRI